MSEPIRPNSAGRIADSPIVESTAADVVGKVREAANNTRTSILGGKDDIQLTTGRAPARGTEIYGWSHEARGHGQELIGPNDRANLRGVMGPNHPGVEREVLGPNDRGGEQELLGPNNLVGERGLLGPNDRVGDRGLIGPNNRADLPGVRGPNTLTGARKVVAPEDKPQNRRVTFHPAE